jgi:periplasmic protein TonB
MKKNLFTICCILLASVGYSQNEPVKIQVVPADDALSYYDKEANIFNVVEVQPEFPGGYVAMKKFIDEEIKYTPEIKQLNQAGKVYIGFTVDATGKISDIKVLKGIHPLIDKEAERVVASMPNWKPGQQNGKNVAVRFNLPIAFK